ncbi:MAG: DUF499 domain-containing protein [Firmicutes bacterium]|nr:DUF499 domain-containing protein [Bacillota bacterium]
MAKREWTPWREVVTLREDVKTGDLSLARFAADLYDVILDRGPLQYRDPYEFFSLTYPTFNLRELVKDVVLRLQGKSEKGIRQLELTYGGGKTHTLITLYHLVSQPERLPDLPAVKEFREHAGMPFPAARVACLPFDKLDVDKGMEVQDPRGNRRWLKQPWSILAYQLAGNDGLKLLHADNVAEERDAAPAENLLAELLAWPARDDLSTLILIDEVLMYVREKIAQDPSWRGRMQNFFQYLTQAVIKTPRCAMVVSLLASDPRKNDLIGKELSRDLAEIFRREQEHSIQPVGKDDVAEILRRQFFTAGSIRDKDRFRPAVVAALKGIQALDETTRKDGAQAEERYTNHYPFHPDLTDVFYTKWTQLEGFQRTRGILRTFALALREAVEWDDQPLISTNIFLASPGRHELSAATRELATVAATEEYEGKRQEWLTILQGELEKAQRIQEDFPALKSREVEQAVVATFLHSQPIGQRAATREVLVLIGPSRPDRIELEKALRAWADTSWFLDEAYLTEGSAGHGLPTAWRLGSRPNLKQMHNDALLRVISKTDIIEAKLVEEIKKVKTLTAGANAAGAVVHLLPKKPSDIDDDGKFHYAVLGPDAASTSGNPSANARKFLEETTTTDRPRVHRNALVLVTLERTGLQAIREQLAVALAWDEVAGQLAKQEMDPSRKKLLTQHQKDSWDALPTLIQQSYCVVVTISKDGKTEAFKMTVDATRPLFEQIKKDERSRIQDTAISADALLPGGPYELWKEGDAARRLKDLETAFADTPALPKMLRTQGIRDTVKQGMTAGLFVLRTWRPDRTYRTWWQEPIDLEDLEDPTMEVVLPEKAELEHLHPEILSPGRVPGLWDWDEGTTVAHIYQVFSGGTTIKVAHDGYEEPLPIPQVPEEAVSKAIAEAVALGRIWLVNGTVSLCGESVPEGVIMPGARIYPPPSSLSVFDVLPEKVPEAWHDGVATALSVSVGISQMYDRPLPWSVISRAITEARNAGLVTIETDRVNWPCSYSEAGSVKLQLPERVRPEPPVTDGPGPKGGDKRIRSERVLKPAEIQNLAEVIGELVQVLQEWSPAIRVTLELNTIQRELDSKTIQRVNALLNEVSSHWEISM